MRVTIAPDRGHERVIRVDFEGEWTWDEFFRLPDEIAAILDTVDYAADIIIDFNGSSHVPTGFSASENALMSRLQERTGRLVFTGALGIQQALLENYLKLFPRHGGKLALVETLDEAYALLTSA